MARAAEASEPVEAKEEVKEEVKEEAKEEVKEEVKEEAKQPAVVSTIPDEVNTVEDIYDFDSMSG